MKAVERILKEVTLEPRHGETRVTRHYRGDTPLGKPAKLQIATFEGASGFYLYYLDSMGREQTDTYHDSIDDAMKQAKAEFGVSPDEWSDVNINRYHEIDPVQERRAARILKSLKDESSPGET